MLGRSVTRHGAFAFALAPLLSGCLLTGETVPLAAIDPPPNYRASSDKRGASTSGVLPS